MSLVQASKALANVLKYGNDAVNKTEELGLLVSPNSVYRIVSARGAYIMSAPNEKAEIIMTAELGTHVVVSRRLNGSKWVEIESPCAGWCALYASGDNIDILLPPQTGDGCAASDSAVRNPVSESGINTEASTRLASAIGAAWRRQLGNLFSDAVTSPTSEQTKTDAATNTIPILLPIKDLMFNRYGSQKPHISSCGHAMHFSCYDDFFTASISKQMSDAFYEHIMSFDTEFRCPMCNAIGNSLIPDVKFCHSIQSTSEVVASSASCADLWDSNRFPIFSRARSIAEADRSDREVDNRILMLSELIYSLCQDKSPLVKKSPIAPPTSGMKKFDRLLQLQASWTCAAHTLLLATCNRRWELKEVLNNSLEKVQISTNELRIISRLLDINVSASRFVSSNVSCSLHTLIFNSGGHGIEPDDSIDALTEEAFNLPNSIIPSSTFEFSAHRAAFSDLAEKYPDQEAENLWPFLKQPLLSHDLHVIAIAALSNCETGQNNLLHVLQLLCLARLVQIMIEPALAPESILQRSRRLAKAPSYLSTHVFPYSEFLKKARSMCGIIGFVDAVTVQVEQAIRLTIIDLFLPFLEYCYNLLLAYGLAIDLPKALDAKESEFDGAPEYAHFAVLLIHLGLPSLENQLERTISGGEKSIIANHVKMWCAGFQKFYEKIGVITASPYIYLTPKPSSMQQDAISGPSKRVYTTNFFVPEDNAILVKDINVENFMENSELGTESSDENNDDDDDADVAIPDAMDIINLMAEAADDSDEYYDSDDSATERMILAAAGSASAKSGWPYVGVDPAFDFIDQGNKDESQLFSSYLGSISGTHSIFDSQGSPLPVGYFDLSCFSIGYRHVASFIDLPNDFTLLYQKVQSNCYCSLYKLTFNSYGAV